MKEKNNVMMEKTYERDAVEMANQQTRSNLKELLNGIKYTIHPSDLGLNSGGGGMVYIKREKKAEIRRM